MAQSLGPTKAAKQREGEAPGGVDERRFVHTLLEVTENTSFYAAWREVRLVDGLAG